MISSPTESETRLGISAPGPGDHAEARELFHAYRLFYSQEASRADSDAYLDERLRRGDSAIFLAREGGRAVGFLQIYPTFSSVSCRLGWILNDLYVRAESRERGVGRELIRFAAEHAARTGRGFIELATQKANGPANALYLSAGYSADEEFIHYHLDLAKAGRP